MSREAKLLFDECVGKPVMEVLAQSLSFGNDVILCAHVLDYQKQGVCDENWLPDRAAEGWIIITADRGRGGKKKGEKLPYLCEAHGVTHVLVSKTVHHLPSADKIAVFISVRQQLVSLGQAPRGSRFVLRMFGATPKIVKVESMTKKTPPKRKRKRT